MLLALLRFAASDAVPQSASLGGGAALPIDPVRILAGLAAGILFALIAALMIARAKHRTGQAPAWLNRLRPHGAPAARIRIVETRRASVHADICLVSWDGNDYLLLIDKRGAATDTAPGNPEPAP